MNNSNFSRQRRRTLRKPRSGYCDGIQRRDFLAWGVLGASPLTVVDYLRAERTMEAQQRHANAGIFIFLNGGPSHQDSFDLKPNAPAQFRGAFRPIATSVPGMEICEHLPKLAKCANKFSILRGVTHTFSAHSLGTTYVNTGTRPLASLDYPGYGSVVAKENPSDLDLPSYVAIPKAPAGAGFLGVRYSEFSVRQLPGQNRPPHLSGITLPKNMPLTQFERQYKLLTKLDRRLDRLEDKDDLLHSLNEFNQQAYTMIRSPRMRNAFDLSKESPHFAGRFGNARFGQACLLAIRLVEAGIRFVTISFSGWDTHVNNFPALQNNLLTKLDQGLSGLFTGLEERGLLDTTAVLVTDEFGRSPKINDNSKPGRDHYSRCMTMLMAGGHIEVGQVVGESDVTASEPVGSGISPDDVAATFYANLGIDPHKQYQTAGRPITLVRDGRIIRELLT